jgi:hypothetical protein
MSDATVGLHTTNTTKATMAFLTQYNLQQRRMRIADSVISVSGNVDVLIRECYEQMLVFCRMVEPAQRIGGKMRIVYTGKHARTNDDLAIVVQLLSLANTHFNSATGRETYHQWHVSPAA